MALDVPYIQHIIVYQFAMQFSDNCRNCEFVRISKSAGFELLLAKLCILLCLQAPPVATAKLCSLYLSVITATLSVVSHVAASCLSLSARTHSWHSLSYCDWLSNISSLVSTALVVMRCACRLSGGVPCQVGCGHDTPDQAAVLHYRHSAAALRRQLAAP